MASGLRGLRALWRMVDDTLHALSTKLQRLVRTLRWLRAILILGILVVLASTVVGIFWPDWFPYAYLAAVLFLVLPLFVLLMLVSAPLQAKSVVRLIDMGYPENTRELAIRAVARKLHEESIETEELLVDVAINEGRKLVHKYKQRAARMREEMDPEPRSDARDDPDVGL